VKLGQIAMHHRPVIEPLKRLHASYFIIHISSLLHGLTLVLLAGSLGAAPQNGSPAAAEPLAQGPDAGAGWLAPTAMAVAEDGRTLFIADAGAGQVDAFDVAQGKVVRHYRVPARPSGLAVNGGRLYVTCAAPESRVCEVDPATGTISAETPTGHTALDPVLSPDRKTLYFCLKFNNQVAAWDTASRRETRRIEVGREPVSAAPTLDGKYLLVAHHLPSGPANAPTVAATVGVVDLELGKMVAELRLPNGSSLAREIRISPDGHYAALAHNLAHFQVPTTQVDRGWMNTGALTLLDANGRRILATVLLDDVDRGAANPWAVAWSSDGRRLFITHAGTHEVSAIDFPALLAKLARRPDPAAGEPAVTADDLSFIAGLRVRVKLAGRGPRTMAVAGQRVYVAGYFSDTIETLEAGPGSPAPPAALLKPPALLCPNRAADRPDSPSATPSTASLASELRHGEALFNDATICFQGWQSCASCHSEDARVDGLNWDLLNDGLGNPKNTKSLLLAHKTPPAMSMGVRISAEEAVRAGLRHILFAVPCENVAVPLDLWLKSLNPMPSPHLAQGALSAAAGRGRQLFNRPDIGCASCHKPGLFTDLKSYDVGTAGPTDQDATAFDTPSLVEVWRTAPYLHDGSAPTLRDVLTARNPGDRHGRTSRLSEEELNDLAEYLLSL
jgi:DNA-binding beta-propeller fold protein YncE/mono/diheme cytochrome c family protein